MRPILIPLSAWLLLSAACCCAPVESDSAVFVVEVAGERFRLQLTDPARVEEARRHLESGRTGVVAGELGRGDGGFNQPYGWHLVPITVRFPDAATEVCDGVPSHVQGDLDYWVDTVGRYCPWGARIVAEE